MSHSVGWVALVIAGLIDVGWAISMKYAEGYTRLGWTLVSLLLLAACLLAGTPYCTIHAVERRFQLLEVDREVRALTQEALRLLLQLGCLGLTCLKSGGSSHGHPV